MIPSFPLVAWLLEATIQGSLAILLVATLVPLLRRRLGAQISHWLWALVLFRLLVPSFPPSLIQWPAPSAPEASAHWQVTAYATNNPASPSGKTAAVSARSTAFPWQAIVVTLWAAGGISILGFAIVRSLAASRLARRATDISHDPGILASLAGLSLAPSRFCIRETRELRSPALCGLRRPIILLPLDWRRRFDPIELRCVLLHEAGHFRRGDLLWRWAFFLTCALHWFNPLVWLASRLARSHQEMACDEWVIAHANAPSATCYGEARLRISTRINTSAFAFPVQAEMAESASRLRRRITNLATARPHGWAARATALLMAFAALAITGSLRSAQPKSFATAEPITTETPPPASTSQINAVLIPIDVKIESKFVQMPSGVAEKLLGGSAPDKNTLGIRAIYSNNQFQKLLREFDQKKDIDLMSAPTVSTKNGNKAVINVIREFRYPTEFDPPQVVKEHGPGPFPIITPTTPTAFETRNVGITLDITPTVENPSGVIKLEVAPEVVDFDGFVNYGSPIRASASNAGDKRTVEVSANVINQPVFSVRRIRTSLSVKSGQTILVGGMNRAHRPVATNPTGHDVETSPASDQVLFVFVTATIAALDRNPSAPISPVPISRAAVKTDANLPYGVPVKDKPGFVTSPHAPYAGSVDVRGFPSNTEVKDPYTGKIFLVP